MVNSELRKAEHIEICLNEDVESTLSPFRDIFILHKALPEINWEEIELGVDFLGKDLKAPLLVSSITGGTLGAKKINENIASAVQELGIGMGVGSQRVLLEGADPESFRIVRERAPDAFIYANIGAPQLKEYKIDEILGIIEVIEADAIAVHLNYLQEVVQPEGDLKARGCLEKIEELCERSPVPVIVKETGAGISREVARDLVSAGVSAIDVGGLGGTSFSAVEVYRARKRENEVKEVVGLSLWDWGILTPLSVVECSGSIPIIASGGIRSGVDVFKCLSLGASLCGVALPVLRVGMRSKDEVLKILETFIYGLRASMFLTGCREVSEIGKVPLLITGRLKEMFELRGYDVRKFARR
jgi:isopentenyl-diphosphate delta-isomerase